MFAYCSVGGAGRGDEVAARGGDSLRQQFAVGSLTAVGVGAIWPIAEGGALALLRALILYALVLLLFGLGYRLLLIAVGSLILGVKWLFACDRKTSFDAIVTKTIYTLGIAALSVLLGAIAGRQDLSLGAKLVLIVLSGVDIVGALGVGKKLDVRLYKPLFHLSILLFTAALLLPTVRQWGIVQSPLRFASWLLNIPVLGGLITLVAAYALFTTLRSGVKTAFALLHGPTGRTAEG
jgi:hypothetical protein